MSCDNLPGNGDVARRMITAFARLKDPALADWMDEHVAFPNCMVDRITPVTAPEDIERLAERVRRRGRLAGRRASRSRSGCSRTTSRRAARRSRTPASSWSTTSCPTS